jgi:hypothetical protein
MKSIEQVRGSDAGKAASTNREWQMRTGIRLLVLDIKYLIQSYVKRWFYLVLHSGPNSGEQVGLRPRFRLG